MYTYGTYYTGRTSNIDESYWLYLILMAVLFVITLIIQGRVRGNYEKYSHVLSSRGITGAQAAKMVLDAGGSGAGIAMSGERLSDHYDPKSDTVCLSTDAYGSTSVSAIGVACHEAGHALQYSDGYGPVKIRTAILPVCGICSKLALPLIIIGLILNAMSVFFYWLAVAGLIMYGVALLFQIVTLPVEFNASRRAMSYISGLGILDTAEAEGARKVLTSAALTYVAAMAMTLLQFLRFASRLRR